MAITAASMVTKYKAKLTALGINFNHTQSETFINALFEAIVDDIQANAVVATDEQGGGTHSHGGTVT